MKPQDDISINPGATYPNLNNLDGSPFFTLLVGDSLCEFTVKERNIEFKAVLAYEPKK